MLDLWHLPPNYSCDVQQFTAHQTGTTSDFMATWVKPRGVTMHYFMLWGGGGGGAGGTSAAAGSTRTGGGGGGGAVLTRLLIPSLFVPDSLGVICGHGGAGGAGGNGGAGTGGSNGRSSSILWSHKASDITTLWLSASGGSGGAGAGTGGAVATANAASGVLSCAGLYSSVNSSAGSNGNTSTPTAPTWVYPFGGGCGGSGVNAATPGTQNAGVSSVANGGGQVEVYPGPQGGAVGGGNRSDDGYGWIPAIIFQNYGGAGGSSSNSSTGGAGGNGGPGSGGGGGGGGTTGTGGIGGAGGNGGDGGVIIISW